MGQIKAKTMIERAGFVDADLKNPKHDDVIKWIVNNLNDILCSLFEDWKQEDIERYIASLNRDIDQNIQDCKNSIEQVEKDKANNLLSKSERPEKTGILANVNLDARYYPPERNFDEEIWKFEDRIRLLGEWRKLGTPPKMPPVKAYGIPQWEYIIENRNGYPVGSIDLYVRINVPKLCLTGEGDRKIVKKPEWSIFTDTEKLFFEAKTKMPTLGELFRQLNFYKTAIQGLYVVVSPDDREAETIRKQGFGFIHCPVKVEETTAQRALF